MYFILSDIFSYLELILLTDQNSSPKSGTSIILMPRPLVYWATEPYKAIQAGLYYDRYKDQTNICWESWVSSGSGSEFLRTNYILVKLREAERREKNTVYSQIEAPVLVNKTSFLDFNFFHYFCS